MSKTYEAFEIFDVDTDDVFLRTRMAEDGYLCLRGLGDAKLLTQIRRDMLSLCAEAGWLDPQADLLDGRWSGGEVHTESEPAYMAVYRQVLKLPSFNALPQETVYTDLMTRLLEAPTFNHKLRIGRITFPQNVSQTTSAHQDWHYVRGTTETYTIWQPLGDCPIELGGLSILKGSHRLGSLEHSVYPEKKFASNGVSEDQWKDHPELTWMTGDLKLGDALIFPSLTIHKAMPNQTKNQIRLSLDNRYQRVGEVIAPGSLEPHYHLDHLEATPDGL